MLPSLNDGEHSLMALIGSKEAKKFVQKNYEIVMNSRNILSIQNIPLTSIPLKVDIFDITGRRIRQWSELNIFPPEESLHLLLPNLPAGVYLVNIKRESQIIRRQFIVLN